MRAYKHNKGQVESIAVYITVIMRWNYFNLSLVGFNYALQIIQFEMSFPQEMHMERSFNGCIYRGNSLNDRPVPKHSSKTSRGFPAAKSSYCHKTDVRQFFVKTIYIFNRYVVFREWYISVDVVPLTECCAVYIGICSYLKRRYCHWPMNIYSQQ